MTDIMQPGWKLQSAGYGSDKANNLSSRFDLAGPLTESVLMGNLAIRSYNIQKKNGNDIDYPGRHIQLVWDGANMKITILTMPTSS
jgi:hypothetical protein